MATKKLKKITDMYVILDVEPGGDAIVDWNAGANTSAEEVIFDNEDDACEIAETALMDNSDFNDTEALTVFKLVPIARVKRAKAVVEKI